MLLEHFSLCSLISLCATNFLHLGAHALLEKKVVWLFLNALYKLTSVCVYIDIPGAVVSSPAVQIVGVVVFDSPALPDSRRAFPGAAVLPSALHLLLLPPQQHGRSDGKLSSLTHTKSQKLVCLCGFQGCLVMSLYISGKSRRAVH